MALDAGLKALLLRGEGPFSWPMQINPTDGGAAIRFSDHAFTSAASGGTFEPRVLQWGDITYQYSDRSGSLSALETQVVISDADRRWSKLAEGTNSGFLVRAPTTISCANRKTPNFHPLFTGVLESWDYPDPLTARLSLRIDDLAMRQSIPGELWKINPYDWRNAPPESWNLYAPILFGSFNQLDYTAKGSVPLILVDPTLDLWLVCAGRAKAVNRVYVNGTASANWTMQYVARGGKWFTVVDWSSTPPADDDDVRADVDGYEYVGDGTGDIIETPVNQLVYFLLNFVFLKWTHGTWFVDFGEFIDTNDIESVGGYLDVRGYRSATRIAEDTTGYDELAEWLRTNELRAYWNNLGKLGLDVEDYDIGYYLTSAVDSIHESGFRMEAERENVLSAVTLNYTQHPAEGKYNRTVKVVDQRATWLAEETINQTWGAAS